jgi:hypothetical protein
MTDSEGVLVGFVAIAVSSFLFGLAVGVAIA